VANCGVLTEGFDEPSVDCILLARPTHSRPLYIQIVGRATRLHPGKEDALIVDFVGASSRHELVTLDTLFGLPARSLREQSVLEAIAAQERAQEQRRAAAERGSANEQERRHIEDIIGRPVDLFHRTPLHWAQRGDVYALAIPGGYLALEPNGDGYRAVRLEGGRVVEQLAPPLPLPYAQGVAEDWARTHDAHRLAAPNAAWRGKPATQRQITRLNSLGIAPPVGMTRGQASDLITTAFAARTVRRGRATR
jgi:hypothetical protein